MESSTQKSPDSTNDPHSSEQKAQAPGADQAQLSSDLVPGQYQSTIPSQPEPAQSLRPKKARQGWKFIFAIIVGLLLIVVSVNILREPSAHPEKAASAETKTSSGQLTSSTSTFAHFADGTYVVGKDIQPGTYRTRKASSNCYYERLSGFNHTLDDIIANANTDKPAVVTIAATDKGFQSTSCGTWTKDLSAITRNKTSFTDGMYIVGTDIQPGTYKNAGGGRCYFARLRSFGNTLGDIISNNYTNSSVIMTISASDKGFQSNHCGTWTKI